MNKIIINGSGSYLAKKFILSNKNKYEFIALTTSQRVLNFYKKEIKNKISKNNILISAHGNSIRALCKYLFKLDENQISKLEIPTGNPLLINLDEEKKIINCKYLDKERAKDLVVF